MFVFILSMGNLFSPCFFINFVKIMRVKIEYDGPFYVLSKRTKILWIIPWWETLLISRNLEYIEKEYMKLVDKGDENIKKLVEEIIKNKYGEKN